IAATNASLEDLVAAGQFREDLYYRLNVIPVLLPPLRERREGIPPLAPFFLPRDAEQNKSGVPQLTPQGREGLKAHDWPGNVRELENALERLIVMAGGGPVTAEHLRFTRARYVLRSARGNGGSAAGNDVPSLIRALVQAGLHAPLPAGKELYEFLVDGLEREVIEAGAAGAGHPGEAPHPPRGNPQPP